nr:hypothetical protein CKG001_10550 [Bdellovibrio sp. CKG001]
MPVSRTYRTKVQCIANTYLERHWLFFWQKHEVKVPLTIGKTYEAYRKIDVYGSDLIPAFIVSYWVENDLGHLQGYMDYKELFKEVNI